MKEGRSGRRKRGKGRQRDYIHYQKMKMCLVK